ncbi:hypothetical protein BHM03_00062354, partial [Ensete ventricosum]
VGYKCKIDLKLLELLKRSTIAKMTCEKLAILCERRKRNSEHEKKPQGEAYNCGNPS